MFEEYSYKNQNVNFTSTHRRSDVWFLKFDIRCSMTEKQKPPNLQKKIGGSII